jgi:hypothetical protein
MPSKNQKRFDILPEIKSQYQQQCINISAMITKKGINGVIKNFKNSSRSLSSISSLRTRRSLGSLLLIMPIATLTACSSTSLGNSADRPDNQPTAVTQANPATTVPTDATPQNSNRRYKELYPPEAIAQYVDVCTAAGDSEFFCNCFVIKAQEYYTLAELVELSKNAHPSKPIPSKVKSIAEFCLPDKAPSPAYPDPFAAPEGLEPPIEKIPDTPSAAPNSSNPNTALASNTVELQPIRSPKQGSCECPYDLDKNNHQCQKRSAYSRPGGTQPSCYVGE